MENNAFGGFGDLFGIEMPVETKKQADAAAKKKEKEEKKKKQTKKSKKDNSKKYLLPIDIHTEWGVITVEGNESLTISEIVKKLEFPLSIVEKDNVFVGVFDNLTEIKSDEKVSGKLFIGKDEYKDIEGNASDYLTNPLKKLYKIKDGLYVLRYNSKFAVGWDLKVQGSVNIGFAWGLNPISESHDFASMNVKEASTQWLKDKEWVKLVEPYYILDQENNCVVCQLQKAKIDITNITVHLPCDIAFIHGKGPEFVNGLRPEMFGNKEYVTGDEILKKVISVFGEGMYSKENTKITFSEPINTVCVQHIGRKKGMSQQVDTGAASFCLEDDVLKYSSNIGKIPLSILNEIVVYFKEKLPTEALAQILYNHDDSSFRVFYPKTIDTSVSVVWDDEELINSLLPNEVVVMEIHSHNTMHAFWSCTDDADETLPMLYGVIGRLDSKKPEFLVRCACFGRHQDLDISDVFMLSLPNNKRTIIREVLERVVDDSLEEAKRKYENSEYVLDSKDYVSTEFIPVME